MNELTGNMMGSGVRMQVTGYVTLTIEFTREGKLWSAVCRELGTAACGKTVDEAKEAILELIELHLDTLEKHGERERFFKKHGVVFHKGAPPATDLRVTVSPGVLLSVVNQPIQAA